MRILLLLVISCTVLVTAYRKRLPYRCSGSNGQLENGNIHYMRKGTDNERRRYSCHVGYVMNIQANDVWFGCVNRGDVSFWRSSLYTALKLTDVKCEMHVTPSKCQIVQKQIGRAECSAPPTIENMEYNILQRYRIKDSRRQPIQGYFTGDTYEYKCKQGFKQVSSKSNTVAATIESYSADGRYIDNIDNDVIEEGPVTCSDDGTWNHTVTDTCVACGVTSDLERSIGIPAPCEKQMSTPDLQQRKMSIQDLQRRYFEGELAIQRKQSEMIIKKNEMIQEQMKFYKNMNLLQSNVQPVETNSEQ